MPNSDPGMFTKTFLSKYLGLLQYLQTLKHCNKHLTMSLPGNCYTDGLSVNVNEHRGMRWMGGGERGWGYCWSCLELDCMTVQVAPGLYFSQMSKTRLHDCADFLGLCCSQMSETRLYVCAGCSETLLFTNVRD